MRASRRLASVAALCLPILLAGCSLFPTTRKLPIPKAPLITQTVTPDGLVARLNQRAGELKSLTAKVEIRLTTFKTKEGLATDLPSFGGQILIRKPEMLRVFGRLPVLGTEAFDLVGDGKDFALYIPSRNKEYKGSYTVKTKSDNLVENIRPGFFYDAMVIRGKDPDDLYGVVADSETIMDAARKHLFAVPEYILTVSRRKPDSQQLTTVRQVTFHRDDLLPYEQDVYDADGEIETQVTYDHYRDFGSTRYPSTITIKRPLDAFQIILTVDSVIENQDPPLPDDQFVISKIREGTQVETLR
jgi:hypothetical protein